MRPSATLTTALVAALVVARAGSAHAQGARTCTVAGVHVRFLSATVHVPGESSFEVTLDGAVASLPIPEGPVRDARALQVQAPLVFNAALQGSRLVHLAHPVDLVEGALHLAPMHTLSDDARWDGAAVREQLTASVDAEIPVALPCDALTLDFVSAHGREDSAPSLRLASTWLSATPVLRVYARPVAQSARLEIPLPNALGLPLRVVGTQRGWSRVHTGWGHGSRLAGYVQSAELRQPTPDERRADSIGDAYGVGDDGEPRGYIRHADEYVGPARIAAQTPVASAPGGPVWAHVARDIEAQVRHRNGQDHVTILGLRGLSRIDERRFWIPLSAVRFPAGTVRHGARRQAP